MRTIENGGRGGGTWEPVAWPEAKPPAEAVDCRNCELHLQRTRVIWGEGRPDAPLLGVLDNPGAREDREGRPFVCATRVALQRAVAEAGLSRDELFVTYLLKCRPVRKYDKEAARRACFDYLRGQLQGRSVIVLLGLVAAQTALDMPDAEMSALRGRWFELGGLPARVTYHPLAVHRRPNLMPAFLEDWKTAAAKLRKSPPR